MRRPYLPVVRLSDWYCLLGVSLRAIHRSEALRFGDVFTVGHRHPYPKNSWDENLLRHESSATSAHVQVDLRFITRYGAPS